MKKLSDFIIMAVASVGMMLMFSTARAEASMPAVHFAGVTIEKGSVNNVTYETGGVGIEERAAMQEGIKGYDLRLVFATTKGYYLASIPVQIKTPDGKVLLSEKSNGPWFWAQLPAGQYEVVASYKNKEEMHKVDVGTTPQSVEFTWKQAQ
jgi:hypothetical protein